MLTLGAVLTTGIDIVVTGNVPVGCGLSSSSSLVCCAALMTITLVRQLDTNWTVPKEMLLESVIKSERNLGLNCGGMD